MFTETYVPRRVEQIDTEVSSTAKTAAAHKQYTNIRYLRKDINMVIFEQMVAAAAIPVPPDFPDLLMLVVPPLCSVLTHS